MEVSMDEILED